MIEAQQVDEDNCCRGLVVVRGPGWEWGDQDGGAGGVGVVLRKFFVDNPFTQASFETATKLDWEREQLRQNNEGILMEEGAWSVPEKLCLAQVRWASGCVQTYRIGTYGSETMTLSDLAVATDQDHADTTPIKQMYEVHTRTKAPEDLHTLELGGEIPPPVELENILLRFFRQRPNVMTQMNRVGDILRDVQIPEDEVENATCDFCDMHLSDIDLCGGHSMEDVMNEMCEHMDAFGVEDFDILDPRSQPVWATRLPCGHIFHRECIRLCMMEDVHCPARDCCCSFEDVLRYVGDDEEEEEEEDGCVSGATLAFICENRDLWLRLASLIQFFEGHDNIGAKMLKESGRGRESAEDKGGGQRDVECGGEGSEEEERWSGAGVSEERVALMWKMRDVLSCVDLPQLEDSGWQLTDAVNKMLLGIRTREVLVDGLDLDSAAVVDHVLEVVSRCPLAVRSELQSRVVDKWSTRHLLHDTAQILQFLAHCILGHARRRETEDGGGERGSDHDARCQQQQGEQGACRDCTGEACGGAVALGELAEWSNLERYVLPALSEVFGRALVEAVREMWAGERQAALLLRASGDDERDSRSSKAIEGLLTLVNASHPLARGRESAEHVKVELEACLFRLALHAFARSCAVTREPRHSLTGLRWLYNIVTKLLQGKRVVIRLQDPLYFTEVAPHSGGKLMLWLLGFRSGPGQSGDGSPSLGADGKLSLHKIDLAFTRRASGLLADSMGAVPPPPQTLGAGGRRVGVGGGDGEGKAGHEEEGGRGEAESVRGARVEEREGSKQLAPNKSPARAAQSSDRNLDLVCRWVAERLIRGVGPEEWAVLELEVLPRLEDIGVGFEGSFAACLAQVRDGCRDREQVCGRTDAVTADALSRVLGYLA